MIDFDISVENDYSSVVAQLPGQLIPNNFTDGLEGSIAKISGYLSAISRHHKFLRTRESRNYDTVSSTEKRIFWFALTESFLIVFMAIIQVYIVRTFFKTTHGRGRI
jgi:hypothetical protein